MCDQEIPQRAFLSAVTARIDGVSVKRCQGNGRTGLQMRVLLETGARVSAFVQVRVEDISFRDLEIRLRHTVAQRLADQGMREELLQQFLGHEALETTQRYYEPRRTDVKEAFEEAMS